MRSSNYFFPSRAEQIKNCVQLVSENTTESTFKIVQFHLHTCLGHNNVIFILYMLIGIPAHLIFDKCIQYTCTVYMAEHLRNVL